MKTRMKIKELELSFLIFGILITFSSASGNDWELQGENQWNYDPSITFNAGPLNNNQGYPQQNQNQFNPGDSQQKDSGTWDSGRTQQPGRTWNQQDAQVKEGDTRNNNQRGRGSWNPADSQVKDGSGGSSNQGWSANDGQVKDTGFGGDSEGNFGPSDAQWKEEGTWSNRRNQGGQQGRGTGSRPGLNQGNDISNRNFGPNDAQRRGSWNTDGRGRPGGWTPDDSQVKDDGTAGGNKQWNVGDEQIKVTPAWDQGVNQQPTGGGRDTNLGTRPGFTPSNQGPSETPGYVPSVEGPAPGRNEGFPNQGLPQDNINRPGSLPGIIESNLRGDDGTTGNDYGPMDQGVTVPGIDGFPANDGRVPQGNYKGGDTGSYPGDDPSQWRLEDSIPGTPGVDYPNYSTIPATGFDCKQHENPGYYGDVEAQCQVFHICQADGRHDAFLCPLGTIFHQQYFVCVWWFNFNCEDTPMYYELNADLYKGGHGGQGNFKGDAYPGGSTVGDSNNAFTTPPTGNVGIIGGPDYGRPGVNREGAPDQNTRPVGDRGVPAAPDSGFLGNQGQTQQGGSIRPGISVTSVQPPQNGNQGATDRPAIEKPEVWIGTGPGTGVTIPQGGSVGFQPNVGGKTNQQSGKRNWSPNQGNSGNWNNAAGNRGNEVPGQIGANRGVKGGNWGNNAGLKSRVWEGTENQQQINFEKRWGTDASESFESEGDTWDSQKDGSSGNNDQIWLNRAFLPDSEEPFWNQNRPEYEDVLGAGTNLLSSTEKLENELSQASNVKIVLTNSQEVRAKNGKNIKRLNSKKTDADVLLNGGKKIAKSGNNKWWKDAKITNILFKNSQNSTQLNVTQTKPESTPVQLQDLKSEDTSLDIQKINFDLKRDYTSDKNSKQRIWTLL